MKPISKIAKAIAPSATMAIDTLSKQMKLNGIDVISFGAGEPDFNTPDHIKAAGIRAIEENKTRYTPSVGIAALRQGICKWLESELGLEYKPEQICVTSGAKHNVFVAIQTLCDPGDEVILPAPYWVTYVEAIRMAGAVPVIVDTTEATGFKMTARMLEDAVTEKTKCLILTNPSNPTGMVYSREELEALAEIIVKNDFYVLSDEIYCSLVYTTKYVSIASLSEEMKKRTVIVNGVSKSYAMTGWRIGFSASNDELAETMGNYLSHSTGSPCSISQYASLAAFVEGQEPTQEMKRAFDERRRYFVQRVENIPGVSCLDPEGAFYVFMNIKDLLGRSYYGVKVTTSGEFAHVLLEKGLVAVVPGSAFGAEGYLRWSYATSMGNIKEGLDRFEEFLRHEDR